MEFVFDWRNQAHFEREILDLFKISGQSFGNVQRRPMNFAVQQTIGGSAPVTNAPYSLMYSSTASPSPSIPKNIWYFGDIIVYSFFQAAPTAGGFRSFGLRTLDYATQETTLSTLASVSMSPVAGAEGFSSSNVNGVFNNVLFNDLSVFVGDSGALPGRLNSQVIFNGLKLTFD